MNKYKKEKFSRLYRKINRSVEVFNSTPNPNLEGATPTEIFESKVKMENLILDLKSKRREWRKMRPEINKVCYRGRQCA